MLTFIFGLAAGAVVLAALPEEARKTVVDVVRTLKDECKKKLSQEVETK